MSSERQIYPRTELALAELMEGELYEARCVKLLTQLPCSQLRIVREKIDSQYPDLSAISFLYSAIIDQQIDDIEIRENLISCWQMHDKPGIGVLFASEYCYENVKPQTASVQYIRQKLSTYQALPRSARRHLIWSWKRAGYPDSGSFVQVDDEVFVHVQTEDDNQLAYIRDAIATHRAGIPENEADDPLVRELAVHWWQQNDYRQGNYFIDAHFLKILQDQLNTRPNTILQDGWFNWVKVNWLNNQEPKPFFRALLSIINADTFFRLLHMLEIYDDSIIEEFIVVAGQRLANLQYLVYIQYDALGYFLNFSKFYYIDLPDNHTLQKSLFLQQQISLNAVVQAILDKDFKITSLQALVLNLFDFDLIPTDENSAFKKTKRALSILLEATTNSSNSQHDVSIVLRSIIKAFFAKLTGVNDEVNYQQRRNGFYRLLYQVTIEGAFDPLLRLCDEGVFTPDELLGYGLAGFVLRDGTNCEVPFLEHLTELLNIVLLKRYESQNNIAGDGVVPLTIAFVESLAERTNRLAKHAVDDPLLTRFAQIEMVQAWVSAEIFSDQTTSAPMSVNNFSQSQVVAIHCWLQLQGNMEPEAEEFRQALFSYLAGQGFTIASFLDNSNNANSRLQLPLMIYLHLIDTAMVNQQQDVVENLVACGLHDRDQQFKMLSDGERAKLLNRYEASSPTLCILLHKANQDVLMAQRFELQLQAADTQQQQRYNSRFWSEASPEQDNGAQEEGRGRSYSF